MALSDEEIDRIARERLGQSSGGMSDADIDFEARKRLAAESYNPINAVADEAVQGLTQGFGDELDAYVASFGPGLARLLGQDNTMTGNDAYNKRLAEIRGQNKGFEADHPYAAIASQIAGSVPTAMMMPGVSTVKGAMALGAGQGALYGFGSGEGDVVNRLESAAGGAILGGGIGGTVTGALQAGGAAINSSPARRLAEYLKNKLPQQRGALNPTDAVEGMTSAEGVIARTLLGQGDEALDASLASQRGAVAENSPQYIAESFPLLGDRPSVPRLQRLAKKIYGDEASMNEAYANVGGRADATTDRLTGIFDDLMPHNPQAYDDGVDAATGIMKGKVDARKAAADPLYQEIRDLHPNMSEDSVIKLMDENPLIAKGLERVREFRKGYKGLGDNSFDVLNETKRALQGFAEQAKGIGNPDKYLSAEYSKAANAVKDLINTETGGKYGKALSRFAGDTEEIARLQDGPLGVIASLSDRKPADAGKKLFAMRPEEIKLLADDLKNPDALKGIVRAHLQDVAGQKDGFSSMRKILQGDTAKKKLSAALGEEEASKLIKSLDREDTFAKFANLYHHGSDSVPNLEARSSFKKIAGYLGGNQIMGGLEAFKDFVQGTSTKGDEALARQLQEILFNPQNSLASLEKIVPFLKDANRQMGKVDWWVDAGSKGGANVGGTLGGNNRK